MIRKMKAEDLKQVAELEQECFSEPWSYTLLESGLCSPYDVYYVCEQDGCVAGYCNLRVLAGEGEVQRIAVSPQHRRKGLARAMMDAMMEDAKKQQVTAISLEVREGNLAARSLYEVYGFLAEAMRKNYYHDPLENAVIMWKRMHGEEPEITA